jgi:histone chaperone ASF1
VLLPIDLEWKVIYVGSAEDTGFDQVLEEVMVGPVPVGVNRFVLQAPAPNPTSIKNEDLIGVTVVLVTCSFMDHEFVRIGYYVNNEYFGR